jgi:hypothetical protein
VRPSFYYNLFDKLISIGTSFQFAQDFGTKMWADSPYLYWNVEPKIQVNIGSGAWAAFVFHFEDRYTYNTAPPREQVTWWNIRLGMTF